MKKILYIGNFSFPFGNAAGKRVYSNGKVFRDLGYEVIYIGVDKKASRTLKLEDTENDYDGFKFYNFPYPITSGEWVNYNQTFISFVKLVDKKIDVKTIDMVIYYGTPSLSLFLKRLIKYCKNNNIIIISDCVDWLTVKTNNPLFNVIKWADNMYQKAYLNKTVDGLITISTFLENYYKKAKLKTVIIPPLSPSTDYMMPIHDKDYKLIVYAGVPFRKGHFIKDVSTLKDRIDKTIVLLSKAKERGGHFKLEIYGFSENEYLKAIPSQKEYIMSLGNSIEFHGMKPNDEVTEVIAKADFTILIRDINRDTTAGFPTKVSESISYGTPVITTKTSDLEAYIIEGETGFFIESKSSEDTINRIIEILCLSKGDVIKMKKKCYNSDLFNHKKYTQKLEKFMNSL